MACFDLRLIAVLCLLVGALASSGGRFRGAGEATRQVATQDIESNLRASLEVMLQGGQGAAGRRLAAVEASLWQTFQALPKNDAGRLSPRAVRYIVHNYFNKEHGWFIKGLEPHGMQTNMSEVHEVSIIQDRAPAFVEALLEARQSDRGLSLSDVVVMVVALEQLIFNESADLLQAAYDLNGLSSAAHLDVTNMREVLTSYLLLFEMGSRANLSDSRAHQVMKASAAKAGGSWPALVEYGEDALLNYGFAHQYTANPFTERHFSFEDGSRMVEDLAQGYGKWQNTECRKMKEELMELSPDGSGRVPLSAFYSQPENADYQFTESLEYLRQIGALDESAVGGPKVRIANYLVGPSNCIASSTYYSVCCLSECEGLMNELEGAVRAPTSTAERLLGLVANLSSSSVDAPRQLPQELADRLRGIAERHGGEVPLHGRLFAQWLHFAFPNECPYPHVAENAAALTPSHWLDGRATAQPEERQAHAEAVASQAEIATEPSPLTQWNDVEVLPVHDAPSTGRTTFRSVVRVVVQLAMLLVICRLASDGWQAARGGQKPGKPGRWADGYALPL